MKRPWTLRRLRCMSHRVVQSNHSCYILITSGNYPQSSRVVTTFEMWDDLKSNVALSVGSYLFMFRRLWDRTLRPALMNAVSTVFFSPPLLTMSGQFFGVSKEVFSSWHCLASEWRVILNDMCKNMEGDASRRTRWEGHAARKVARRGAYRVLVGKPEGNAAR
jgi:hypothetical protein